jgi:hypothetical protein
MMLIFNNNEWFPRFASCVDGAGMLSLCPQVAGCTIDGEGLSIYSAGNSFTDDFKPVVTSIINITRCGIFRGKVSQRKTQNHKKRLEERTLSATHS